MNTKYTWTREPDHSSSRPVSKPIGHRLKTSGPSTDGSQSDFTFIRAKCISEIFSLERGLSLQGKVVFWPITTISEPRLNYIFCRTGGASNLAGSIFWWISPAPLFTYQGRRARFRQTQAPQPVNGFTPK